MNANKNILLAVAVFLAVFGLLAVGNKVIIDKISERVIEKLQREYSPGPYQPGFDPDKINPDFFKQPQMPPGQQPPPGYQMQQQPGQPGGLQRYGSGLGQPADWNNLWENQRR